VTLPRVNACSFSETSALKYRRVISQKNLAPLATDSDKTKPGRKFESKGQRGWKQLIVLWSLKAICSVVVLCYIRRLSFVTTYIVSLLLNKLKLDRQYLQL